MICMTSHQGLAQHLLAPAWDGKQNATTRLGGAQALWFASPWIGKGGQLFLYQAREWKPYCVARIQGSLPVALWTKGPSIQHYVPHCSPSETPVILRGRRWRWLALCMVFNKQCAKACCKLCLHEQSAVVIVFSYCSSEPANPPCVEAKKEYFLLRIICCESF